nr:nitroreductase [Hylemonella gracilis]
MDNRTFFSQLCIDRRSVRGYLPTSIPTDVLEQLLMAARAAPSGANLQPGSFTQVKGKVREALSADLIRAWRAGEAETEDYDYFPKPMPMTLRKRQVAAAQALYGAIGVARDDRAGRDAQFERNFRFFDAPVALLVTLEHGFGSGGYMDLGMTLYGLMLAAQAHGLATCAIGAMASYPSLIRRHLGLQAHSVIVCGLALGYADPDAPVNQTRTERCALGEYFRVLG